MANKKCPKCGAELISRNGYSVCNSCGEIVAAAEGEMITADEEIQEVSFDMSAEPVFAVEEYVPEEVINNEDATLEEVIEEIDEPEDEPELRPEETFYVVPEKKKKTGKKKSAAPILVLILCAMLAVGGYYVVKDMSPADDVVDEIELFDPAEEEIPPVSNTEDEGTSEEVPVFDEPVAKPVESLEGDVIDEPEKTPEDEKAEPAAKPDESKEEKPATTPAVKPATKPATKPAVKPAVTQQPKEEEPAPVIKYRIRKSADDSQTQIGAFADLERAKNFAASHAADGYKVFDMDGNLVYQP